MKKEFLKPAAPGGIVRFPEDPRHTLAEDGEEVELTTFWQRRINDGSVIAGSAKKEGRK